MPKIDLACYRPSRRAELIQQEIARCAHGNADQLYRELRRKFDSLPAPGTLRRFWGIKAQERVVAPPKRKLARKYRPTVQDRVYGFLRAAGRSRWNIIDLVESFNRLHRWRHGDMSKASMVYHLDGLAAANKVRRYQGTVMLLRD